MKMTKYEVTPFKDNHDYMWAVYELATEQVIDTFYFEEDANSLAKKLDRGHGFDGWTPKFMLTKVIVNENINQKFNQLFRWQLFEA